MTWYTQGLQTGLIAADTLLAEMVNTSGSQLGVAPVIMISGNVASVFEIQHRNAANTGNVFAHRIFVTVSSGFVVPPSPVAYYLDPGERLRVQLILGLLAGQVQASMFG